MKCVQGSAGSGEGSRASSAPPCHSCVPFPVWTGGWEQGHESIGQEMWGRGHR